VSSGTVENETFQRHLITGGDLLRRDRVEEARTEFEAALDIRPNDKKALGLVGLTCFRLNAYADALTVYRRLVDDYPEDPSYRLNLGLVHLKLGQADDAIVELQRTRELDPAMAKAVGYLGLAYARKGEYLAAYEAFSRVGQTQLAREMEQHLRPNEIAAVRTRLNPEAEIPDLTEVATEDVEATAPAAPSKGNGAGVADPPEAGHAVSQALEAVVPSAVAEAAAKRTALGHHPPQSISEFVMARMIRPDDSDHPFEISAGGVLIVRVNGRVMSRTEGVIVSGGELAYEPATRKVRGNLIDEPFSDDRPLFIVGGEGYLIASPLGNHFSAVSLDDDVLYLREDLVFAFEDKLRWENGYVPGSNSQIRVVQFRGQGCAALRTKRPPLSVKLGRERVLYVDADALAGWVGRVVPRVVAPAAGGESSALFVECSGEGVVLLEDEAPAQSADSR
jgi:uncharacterized protein (AIM24 family)